MNKKVTTSLATIARELRILERGLEVSRKELEEEKRKVASLRETGFWHQIAKIEKLTKENKRLKKKIKELNEKHK